MIENLLDRRMNSSQFGVTFFTSSQRQDTCGSNGLPLTPNSIRILGRSKYLKYLNHPNLSEYVDIVRGKHERIIVIFEYYSTNLRKLLKNKDCSLVQQPEAILSFAEQVLSGLCYLNNHGIVNRNLCLENILFDANNQVKIFNYGLYYMTNNGKYVSFPVGSVKYTAPEVFLSGPGKGPAIYSCDSWSLGLILVELAIGEEIWSELKLSQIIRKVASLAHCGESGVLQRIFQEHHSLHVLKDLNPQLKLLMEKCLEISPAKRSCPQNLIKNQDIFKVQVPSLIDVNNEKLSTTNFQKFFRSSVLTPNFNRTESSNNNGDGVQNGSSKLEDISEVSCNVDSNSTDASTTAVDHLAQRSLKEVYHLWQLAGGDVFAELKRQGLTRKKPSALSLPCSMTLEGQSAGKTKERGLLLDQTVIVLPQSELRKRLRDIPPEEYYPLVETKMQILRPDVVTQSALLPLVIREKDIEYQFHRILLFDRLIKGYPYTKSILHKESLLDIPPFFRAQIWSCLLEIDGDTESVYSAIDKETPTSTDRQIEVDIPRCHQYDELLSSPTGHEKFKRVLKAWVVNNTKYVYWQGLDSLCAPFLYLNFNDEAMAYSCLSAFIPKYLYNFFLKDNSMVIQEYLAKFSQLIAFHDPQLTNHLDSIGFIPELYAIPWFLTMFSHVFPLHKIFHLWDKLLLGDSSFSLCIGLAILYQLRDSLLTSGFNECILLFSDMPEVNIERCVKDAVEIYCSTPKSALCRKHEPPSKPKHDHGSMKNFKKFFQDTGSKLSFNESLLPTNNDGLKMEAISLEDLKNEKCPRISGEDFLYLLDLNKTKFPRPKMIVVDVRNHEDYNRGAIPTSINIPYSTSIAPDSTLISSPELNTLNANRGKVITIVGNRGDSAVKFAEIILRLGYPRICILHRGIDIFRTGSAQILQIDDNPKDNPKLKLFCRAKPPPGMLYGGGRPNYDEILSLKQSKAEAERSRDEAVSRIRDLELKYADLLLELKQLTVTDANRHADLECQLKVKTYELDRCSILLGETDAKHRFECTEKEKLARKLEVLREELTTQQTHAQKVICSLKLQLQDKSGKLSNYERLETELDKIILRAASLQDPEDAKNILSTYEKEAFIPINSKRRLEQSLNLARRVLELENVASELKSNLFKERDLKQQLQNELTATKACLQNIDYPTAELIDLLLKRNVEIQKLQNTITVLQQEIVQLKQNEQQLRRELRQASSHGQQQLGAIKKMISNLHESKVSQTVQQKMQGKTKVHWLADMHTQVPSPTVSNQVIHIKKPITFSKLSQSSLARQFGAVHHHKT